MLIFLTVLLITSCEIPPNSNEIGKEHPIKSEILLTKLDELIYFRDSITFRRTPPDTTFSFWIFFTSVENECFVTLTSQFNFYDSEDMDGYFIHRDRYITVYDSKSECAKGFIDPDLLNTDIIDNEVITDYCNPKKDRPPIPPHNAFGREYRIIDNEQIELISQGFHIGRPQPEHRIPPKPPWYDD